MSVNFLINRKFLKAYLVISIFIALIPLHAQADDWHNSSFQYRKIITIDHTRVEASLTNFSVLIILNIDNFNFSKTQNNGEDIRFITITGTELSYEIERWNNTLNKAEIWVKIPAILATTDTIIHMYYGNSTISDGQDTTGISENAQLLEESVSITNEALNDTGTHSNTTVPNPEFMVLQEPAEYGEDSGINNINTDNCTYWSNVLSNRHSTVTCDINVYSGTLNLNNATIIMTKTRTIYIKDSATLNMNSSTFTRSGSSGYYYVNFEEGSFGNLTNSTIEYTYQLQIATKKNMTINGCTIGDNYDYGIYLSTDSGYMNITNTTISNIQNYYGIYLASTYGHVNLSNCTVSDCNSGGVYIISSGSNILRDNDFNNIGWNLVISGNYNNDIDTSNTVNGGLVYYRHDNNSISAPIINQNIGHITLYNCSNILVKDNTLVSNGDGICLVNSMINNTIDHNVFNNSNFYGIKLSSSNANITNNIIDSQQNAISLSSSNNCVISNNTISCGSNDDISGIFLTYSWYNSLINNKIIETGTGGNGIELESTSNDNNLTDNIITNSGSLYGILLSKSSNNDIINNTVKNKDRDGLYLESNSNYNTISSNNFSWNDCGGITVYSGSHNIIDSNNISYNQDQSSMYPSNGVTIFSGTNNSINSNTISNNVRNGIGVDSAGNNFFNNIITNNLDNGIYIQTDDNIFSQNTITIDAATGYGFYIDFGQYDNYIYQNNTVNGEHIYYYYNINTPQTITLEPLTTAKVSNVGKITLIKCSNFIIGDNTLSNNIYIDGGIPSGIFLYNSSTISISNNTISDNYQGIYFYNSSNSVINNNNRINTSEDNGIYFDISDYNNITNNNLSSNVCLGINLTSSDYNNITGNSISGSPEGIRFTTSLNNSLYTSNITDYSFAAIRLIEYSKNNVLIGNIQTNNGAQFDIHINDSNSNTIAPNESIANDYTFYLTDDTRLCTLDTQFNKSNVGYEDTSNLTLMWRIDVLSWDNKHIEPIWGDLTVRYGDYSEVGGIFIWGGTAPNENGRLSNNPTSYWGPPTSSDNWLPVIEYKENSSIKVNYQSRPMNCTVINKWDELQGIDKSYQNITTMVTESGITIIVNAGYTPNGKCYYCHMDKLTFVNMNHWKKYSENLLSITDPYTPGRCIDCHNETDSASVPHGTASGKDLLLQQSPGLCYTGNGNQNCHNASAWDIRLDQETQFSSTRHHQLGDGKLSCFACHDNHGTEYDFDLHKKYTDTVRPDKYKSSDYALCFVCHLEEKITARMTGYSAGTWEETYANKTNMLDRNFNKVGFNDGYDVPKNVHKYHTVNARYSCYDCHNSHGTDNPAMTRDNAYYETGKTARFNFRYITGISSPDDWLDQQILDNPDDWNNSEINQAGGLADPACCGCHGKDLPNYFSYREYIDYEAAGGAGCVECHDNGRSDAIRKIVNVSAIKTAMHANLSLAFRDGANLQGTDKNFMQWLEYRGYTSAQIAQISTDNAICWSCHNTNGTPPYPEFHPDRTLNPYKCAKCHGPIDGQPLHTAGLVKAIDNHGPTTKGGGSIYIQTDVGSNGSCGDCHAPSLLPESSIGDLEVWKYTNDNGGVIQTFIDYAGRTTMGDVSHYGLSKSQGLALGIENPLFNTSDCLYCHCNSTNGAIWGNAVNINGNMYGADTSNVSECYTYCHVLPDYLETVNETSIRHFHNISIFAGGGPDCIDCHDSVNNIYHVQSLVNATSIAQGIHANVTNNTIELVPDIDPKSKPCWGCHQSDGTEPEGMGDRNGITDPDKKPWTCYDCHCRSSDWVDATDDGQTWLSSSYPANKLPPEIYAHHPNSSTAKTNVNGEGRCVDCHNASIDADYNDTAEKVLGNTIYSNVSHYATKSDLIIPTEDCGICHNSITNATDWGNAPQNTHGSFSNYSAEDGCYSCHTNDDQTPADFHAENLCFGEGGYDCLRCHNTNGFAIDKRINGTVFGSAIHKDMNNASSMDYSLNRSCWVCHFEEGDNADDHSLRKDPPYLCYECHNKITPPFDNVSNAPNAYNHFKDGTSIQAYWTESTNSISCLGCHNKLEMLISCSENDSYSTDFSITSHYGKNRTDLVDKYNEADSTEYCEYCHKNDSTPFIQWNKLKKINHGGTKTCDECHGTGRLHNNSLTRVKTKGNCTDCHALYGNAQPGMNYKINVTAMNMGVHANVNSNMRAIAAAAPINDINNAMCWGCHVPQGAYPVEGHKDTFNNDAYLCYECHNGTAAYANVDSATAVYNHFKGGINITARTDATTNSTSCGYGCHNLTTMKVAGFDAGGTASYRVNLSQASHYACNRTDIAITSDLSDCTWCHRNASNEFIDIFNDQDNAKINHAVDTSGCILPICHNRGRIHDQELTIPSVNWNECEGCHFGLSSYGSSAYVNQTMFNASVHVSVGCTDCHINTTLNHPVEEYTWKWCECCHSYQNEPVTMSDRHNVTRDPLNYTLDVSGDVKCVMNITNCTVCHDAAEYNSAVNDAVYRCRYCHAVPDKGNKTAQSWY